MGKQKEQLRVESVVNVSEDLRELKRHYLEQQGDSNLADLIIALSNYKKNITLKDYEDMHFIELQKLVDTNSGMAYLRGIQNKTL